MSMSQHFCSFLYIFKNRHSSSVKMLFLPAEMHSIPILNFYMLLFMKGEVEVGGERAYRSTEVIDV